MNYSAACGERYKNESSSDRNTMAHAENEITINRPAHEVYSFLARV